MNKRFTRVLCLAAAMVSTLVLCVGCSGGDAPETTTTTTAPSTTAVTTTTRNAMMNGEVNVRSGPGFDHPALGGIQAGASVVIVGREGDWYKIEYDGGYGYISAHYVDVSGQSNASQMLASRVTGDAVTTMATTLRGTTAPTGNGTTAPTGNGTTTTAVGGANQIPDTQVEDAF